MRKSCASQFSIVKPSRCACAGEAAERDAAPPFAQIITVEPVSQISEGYAGGRVGPCALTAEARMAERLWRICPAKAAQVSPAVVTGDHNPKGSIRQHSPIGVLHGTSSDFERLTQHLRLPNLFAVIGTAFI